MLRFCLGEQCMSCYLNGSNMRAQTSLCLDSDLVNRANKQAERENRSLADFVETLLTEALLSPPSGGRPLLSAVDCDLKGLVALADDGTVDLEETEGLGRLLDIADKGAPSS